ncbi:thiamine phosphate synthase [Pedobacter sp. SYP-B3415]|uniref:thiamine phosphate synthase n=1 Tax=Pedobacter sp. SYP-B3415 TaxID=2496641 RepID=UPI00101CD06D|nr:thiamine phosphate synthase [Pedobacter sp. SYP-B3415]
MNRVQYISQGQDNQMQIRLISEVLDAGCTWIQLRHKQAPLPELRELAAVVAVRCARYKATFIINDYPELALEVGASGVHLGLNDTPVCEARALLGNDKIIGGTANTIEDIRQRITEGCDYIGLGPFAFTPTKEKLSPILGLRGYKTIFEQLSLEEKVTPIYAIGGITLSDVPALATTGLSGIAVSGMLSVSLNKHLTLKQLNESFLCQTL